MRTKLFVLTPLAVVLVACSSTTTGSTTPGSSGSPSIAATSPSASASSAASTFVLNETLNTSTYTAKGATARPGGPTGEPADGDVWEFSSLLQQDGKAAGTDHVTIAFGSAGTATIDATETLETGSIVAHGTAPFQPTLTIPVVSGTAGYAGATGTITIVSRDNTHNDLTIALK